MSFVHCLLFSLLLPAACFIHLYTPVAFPPPCLPSPFLSPLTPDLPQPLSVQSCNPLSLSSALLFIIHVLFLSLPLHICCLLPHLTHCRPKKHTDDVCCVLCVRAAHIAAKISSALCIHMIPVSRCSIWDRAPESWSLCSLICCCWVAVQKHHKMGDCHKKSRWLSECMEILCSFVAISG